MQHRTFMRIAAVLFVATGATSAMNAQIPLQAALALRPVTPGDIANYSLPSTTDVSAGLTNVGIGQPAYLEADINIAVPASDIAGVTWTLNLKPAGSNASIGTSPLTSSVPVFEPSDRLNLQVAGRALLRPDVVGAYQVTVVVNTKSNGSATIAQTIFGATYVGIAACSKCHDGTWATLNKEAAWSTTLHSHVFSDGITGVFIQTINYPSYPNTCYGCHTVGYDPSATVNNGGFFSLSNLLSWTTPTSLVPANWGTGTTAMPAALQNVANVQCENCHGAGSLHANDGGTPFEITVPSTTGTCSQCHDEPSHHIKTAEWSNSMHAVTTSDPAATATCVGCHTTNGFIARSNGATTLPTGYGAINCQTCHEPHGQTTPTTATHQIRTMGPVTLADGTIVADAGEGALCIQCHQARVNAKTYVDSTAGSAHFGPHEGPQADMLEGVNGYTYGQTIPTSAHQFVVPNTCVGCHMQTVATTDPGFLNVGGHTFKPSYTPPGANATKEDLVAACQTCHGPDVTSFDFPLFDYDGTGNIQGVQTEVQYLLDQLSTMLPPAGKPKTALTIDATWTKPQLEAGYNWLFVTNDGSKGIHNMAYTVGLLKTSIANLSAGK
jgi:hypothetical protein